MSENPWFPDIFRRYRNETISVKLANLTHLFPMQPSLTKGFLIFSEGRGRVHWEQMGYCHIQLFSNTLSNITSNFESELSRGKLTVATTFERKFQKLWQIFWFSNEKEHVNARIFYLLCIFLYFYYIPPAEY